LPMPLFIFFNTQTMLIKSIIHNSTALFLPIIFFTRVGLEPVSLVPVVHAMSTALRNLRGVF
jgi:hypothetical protein